MRVVLGIPAYKQQISWQCAQMLLSFQADYFANWIEGVPRSKQPPFYVEYVPTFVGHCDVNYAHSVLLRNAIDTYRADWLVVCGADQWAARVDEFTRMIGMLASGDANKAAIIGAPVALSRGKSYNVQLENGKDLGPFLHKLDNVFSVARIGSGFCGYSCNWFRSKWPDNSKDEWFRSVTAESEEGILHRYGLDYWICDQVRKRGGKILCDKRVSISHERTYDLANEFGEFHYKQLYGELSLIEAYQERFIPPTIKTGKGTE